MAQQFDARDGDSAWEESVPTPLQELAKALAREAVNASTTVAASHGKVEAIMDQLRAGGIDQATVFALDQAVNEIHIQVLDLAATVGLEVGRRFRPQELLDTIVKAAYLGRDYGIGGAAPTPLHTAAS